VCNGPQDPAKYVPALQAAGANSVTFQIEPFLEAAAAGGGSSNPADSLAAAVAAAAGLAADIRARGMKAAVALAVGTGVEAAVQLVQQGAVDMVRYCFLTCDGTMYNKQQLEIHKC
jgi:pentose-5-phosphate-3-epimerase